MDIHLLFFVSLAELRHQFRAYGVGPFDTDQLLSTHGCGQCNRHQWEDEYQFGKHQDCLS